MRLFIIGRIFEGDKLIAYKIYDANSKKTGIYPKENVWSRLRENHKNGQGILIVGLSVLNNGSVVSVHSSYNISKTDKLNGKGYPIEPSDSYILVGFSGYSEDKRYRLVNSNGYEKIVSQKEFEALVEEDKVNGAIKSARIKDKIVIYKKCNYREYHY